VPGAEPRLPKSSRRFKHGCASLAQLVSARERSGALR
jgi:hypothetical protein